MEVGEDCQEQNFEDETKNASNVFPRYCTACHVDQPVRARHCVRCERCVLTFDHHCPFLGVCIGEKNRHIFFLYIFVQLLECCFGVWFAFWNIGNENETEEWVFRNVDNLILGLASLGLGLFVLSLCLCHIWLAGKNLTTYEVLRWEKVHYLGEIHKFQSPFSRGLCVNFRDYMCPQRKPKEWRVAVSDHK